MQFIEKVSGSFELKKDYQKTFKKLQDLENKIYETNEVLKSIRKDKQNAINWACRVQNKNI